MSLDQLRIVRRIGHGSIGDVLLVGDDSGNEYALRKIPTQSNADQIRHLLDFALPLQATLLSVCPQVIEVHDWEKMDDILYVRTEYIEGDDLADVLQHGSISEKWAIDIAMQVCDALIACHELPTPVLHGDLKPRSVRLELGQKVRVLGFSMKAPVPAEDLMSELSPWSHPYLSPERIENGRVTVASDLWALGILLYKMVSGALPFFSDSPRELHRMITKSRAPQLRKGSPDLARLIYRALGPDPTRRFASARHFRQALEDLRTDIARQQRDLKPSTESPPRPRPTTTPRERPQRPGVVTHSEAKIIGFRPVSSGIPLAAGAGGVTNLGAAVSPAPTASKASIASAPPTASAAAVANSGTRGPTSSPTQPAPTGPFEGSADGGWNPRQRVRSLPEMGTVEPDPAQRPRKVTRSSEPAKSMPDRPSPPPVRALRLTRIVTGLALTLVFLAIVGQLYSWSRIAPLQHQLNSSTLAAIDESWVRYARLCRFMSIPIGPGLNQVEAELEERLLASSRAIFDSYHADIPTTRESNWRQAEARLRNVLTLSPDDSLARAMWYCSQGHILRFEADAFDSERAPSEAMLRRSEAVAKFERSTALAPSLADPHLGLARIYAYDRFDLPALERALHDAERCGYDIGQRERAQLAGAYHRESRAVYADARQSSDPIRRRDDRRTAMMMAHRATRLYAQIPGFARADENKDSTFELVQKIKRMPIEP